MVITATAVYTALLAAGIAKEYVDEWLANRSMKVNGLRPGDFQNISNSFIKAHSDNPAILAKISKRIENINLPYNMSHSVNKAIAKYRNELDQDYNKAVAADTLATEAKNRISNLNADYSLLSDRNKRKKHVTDSFKEGVRQAEELSSAADKTMNELGERYV